MTRHGSREQLIKCLSRAETQRPREAARTVAELVNQTAQFKSDMDEADKYELLERFARSEPMRMVRIAKTSSLRPPTHHYRQLFPHPLPIDYRGQRKLDNDTRMREISLLRAPDRCWRAVTSDMPWCLEELYLQGFPVHTPNADGLTPLHLAAHFGYYECCEVLLNAGLPAGVDMNASTTAGVTPWQSAEAAGHADVLELLMARGAVRRIVRPLAGYRSVLDVAADRMGPSVAHDAAKDLGRRPYFLGF